ncbi:hypothetical protein GCM10010306_091150 [Streptomyces umbrinus]|uniref:hypothetical protein n=1 Tax=Streptomyces umbrinus TaxID=67370 RepID=UPI00167B4FB1|nr:hypothetical protein [Streptomyces umbrinus]GHB82340.1 hypothetical protein GCM10010306_091150 [Streptomyces umbrinus]
MAMYDCGPVTQAAALDAEPQSSTTAGRRRWIGPRCTLFVRRGIGLAIALGVAHGIFHIIFRTEVLAPVLAYVGPVKDFTGWVVEVPGRAWIALAALVIPHIGLYYLLFEDRK